jgi:ketosteroid isomerase-like protein
MSDDNVEVVRRAVSALNERDIDRYLACCTEDFELVTPLAPIGGVYEGADAIRRFFADIQDTSPDFRLDLERVEAVGADRVLGFLHLTASGRASGIPAAAGLPPRTSTTSSTARSAASESSSTGRRLSKPRGCGSSGAEWLSAERCGSPPVPG